MVLKFLFWNISFKVCSNACNMPSFGKKIFSSICTQFRKINDTDNIDNSFCTILLLLKPEFVIQSL